MKVHEIFRSAEPLIKFHLPDSCIVPPGDILVLESNRGRRKFIMTIDMSTGYHCKSSCGISKNTCRYYKFKCPYFCYLKPVDDVLEEL